MWRVLSRYHGKIHEMRPEWIESLNQDIAKIIKYSQSEIDYYNKHPVKGNTIVGKLAPVLSKDLVGAREPTVEADRPPNVTVGKTRSEEERGGILRDRKIQRGVQQTMMAQRVRRNRQNWQDRLTHTQSSVT